MSARTTSHSNHRTRSRRRPSRASAAASMPSVDGMAHDVINRVRDLTGEALHAADRRVSRARKTADAYVKAGRKRAVRLEQSLEHGIGERPLMSLLAASIVGFLLGMLLCRR